MKLTKEMLIDWIDRPPSNSDLDLINYIIRLQNNRNEAVREIINMIENGNIEFFKGKKLENILMGDSDEL